MLFPNKKQSIQQGIGVLGAILLFFVMGHLNGNREEVEATFRDDDMLIVECSKDSQCFAFDTGANVTVLYSDTVPDGFFRIPDIVSRDIFSRESTLKRCFSFKSNLIGIDRWLQTLVLLPESVRVKGAKGIWGTDIIDHSCWWIDFANHRISNKHTPPKTPDYVLTYYKHRNLYYTDIVIGEHHIDSLMIDLGYTRSDMALVKGRIAALNFNYSEKLICYNMADESDSLDMFNSETSIVNGRLFNHLTVTVLPARELLGLPFFRRFSAIYIDTNKQKILCYD